MRFTNRATKVAAMLLGLLIFAGTLTGCSDRAGVSEYVVVVEKGLFDAESIKTVLFPGETTPTGDHQLYYLPAGVRNYIAGPEGDIKAIPFVAKGGISMQYQGSAPWILVPDKEELEKFFLFCQKYQCASDEAAGDGGRFAPSDGWNGMLRENMSQAWIESVKAVGGNYTREELTSSTELWDEFSTAVSEDANRRLSELMNGRYFCSPATQQEEEGGCLPIKFTTGDLREADEQRRDEREAQAARASELQAQLDATRKQGEIAAEQDKIAATRQGAAILEQDRQIALIEACQKAGGKGFLVIVGGSGVTEVNPQVPTGG